MTRQKMQPSVISTFALVVLLTGRSFGVDRTGALYGAGVFSDGECRPLVLELVSFI